MNTLCFHFCVVFLEIEKNAKKKQKLRKEYYTPDQSIEVTTETNTSYNSSDIMLYVFPLQRANLGWKKRDAYRIVQKSSNNNQTKKKQETMNNNISSLATISEQ